MGDSATNHLIGRISAFSQNNLDILNHSTNVEHVYGGAGWGWRSGVESLYSEVQVEQVWTRPADAGARGQCIL